MFSRFNCRVFFVLQKDIELILFLSGFVIFLEFALLDPPSRHKEFTIKDVLSYKGPFAHPGGSDPEVIDKNSYKNNNYEGPTKRLSGRGKRQRPGGQVHWPRYLA